MLTNKVRVISFVLVMMLFVCGSVYAQNALEVWGQIGLGAGTIGEQLSKMFDEFQAETGIQINYVSYPEHELNEKFVQAVIGGVAPDVIWTTSGGPWGEEQGLFLPLDDYIEQSEIADWDDFFGAPKEHSMGMIDGRIYAVPLETDARVLVWNKAHFGEAGLSADEPPLYWDELLAYIRRLTRLDGDNRLETAGFEFAGQGQWLALWVHAAGGSIWDTSTIPPVAIPDRDAMVRALGFVQDVVRLQGGWSAYSPYTEGGTSTSHARFQSSTAMYIAGSWEIPGLIHNFPDLDFDIAPIPIERVHGRDYTLSGGWQVGIPATVHTPDISWKFIEWITSPEKMAEWALVNGYIPPRYSAIGMSEFSRWPENVLAEIAVSGGAWPRTYPGTSYSWHNAFLDVLQEILPPEAATLQAQSSMQVAADEFFVEYAKED